MNKKYCVVGNPIEHSISPKLHNFTYEALGIDAIYSKFLLENEALFKDIFFSHNFDGANITVPFKESAYHICDEIKGIAEKIRAVNTIVKKNGKLYGYNTDAPGFLKAIEEFSDIKNVLIIGAGGTAKAISFILREHAFYVNILNRSENRLLFFKDENFKTFTYEDNLPNSYDLIVNTTSAGLSDNELPAPIDILSYVSKNAKFAFDVVYNRQTPFLDFCKKSNIAYKDGSDMLLYQAAFAFNLFFDNKYKESEITKAMRQAFIA
ncbi:MAG: shikimate dehydrogenase [Campylobacteraceae bacterium]|nr:shikimate dehydrogenase [Campylobacteraceae bacterium]